MEVFLYSMMKQWNNQFANVGWIVTLCLLYPSKSAHLYSNETTSESIGANKVFISGWSEFSSYAEVTGEIVVHACEETARYDKRMRHFNWMRLISYYIFQTLVQVVALFCGTSQSAQARFQSESDMDIRLP